MEILTPSEPFRKIVFRHFTRHLLLLLYKGKLNKRTKGHEVNAKNTEAVQKYIEQLTWNWKHFAEQLPNLVGALMLLPCVRRLMSRECPGRTGNKENKEQNSCKDIPRKGKNWTRAKRRTGQISCQLNTFHQRGRLHILHEHGWLSEYKIRTGCLCYMKEPCPSSI